MITRYRFALEGAAPLFPSQAYPIYAWLLTQIPAAYGAALHQQGATPFSQYLVPARNSNSAEWVCACLGEESEMYFRPVLQALTEIPLHSGTLRARLLETTSADSPEAFYHQARQWPETSFFRVEFLSPAAFKRDNQYVIFPEIRLFLHSLTEKWDAVFPEYSLSDSEALGGMEAGIKLTDYRLQSCRFPMKKIRIPSFKGQIITQARLSPPLLDLWRQLLAFSCFAGVGMKTALGMGGINVIPSEQYHF